MLPIQLASCLSGDVFVKTDNNRGIAGKFYSDKINATKAEEFSVMKNSRLKNTVDFISNFTPLDTVHMH